MGLGTIGGFKFFVEDRADLGYDALYQNLQAIHRQELPDARPGGCVLHASPSMCRNSMPTSIA